ncbi:hypothetical protein TrST_g2847 [Triparma strigata]|uniref:WLM domain-containing protein n=1 Tax=Triparma strigata TaxID=1606541 RepID=A0A9W7B0W3_9STRA|nr:hypothetical protein TrST_g2847 [Triparma strigata]
MPPKRAPPPAYPPRPIPPSFRRISTLHIQPQIKDSSQEAYSLLLRLENDFTPYLHSRNFTIQSLNELCCCGKSKMGKNHSILGYCMPAGNKVHSRGIYIRLRRPQSHEFLPYDDIFGTMCHEVTHIVHGSHSAEFYEEMEVIRKGVEGMMGSKDYMVFGGEGNFLGGGGGGGSRAAAEDRRRVMGIMSVNRLGGGLNKSLDKKEVMRRAAERRMRDEVICGECVEDEDDGGKEVGGADDVIDVTEEEGAKRRKRREGKGGVIDLTADEPPSRSPPAPKTGGGKLTKKPARDESKRTKKGARTSTSTSAPWPCPLCTLLNPPTLPSCSACSTPSPSLESSSLKTIKDLITEDIKDTEKSRSVQEFGFDIYGSKKKSTRLSGHLT